MNGLIATTSNSKLKWHMFGLIIRKIQQLLARVPPKIVNVSHKIIVIIASF